MFATETVYGCDGIGPDEDAHVMSDRVQAVATNIYREFERMIPSYGEEVVKEMMPHIVNVLETLDLAFKENQEREAELELCKDDNEQLMSQYEREKQLRKSADQKLLAIEDLIEEEKKEMNLKLESHKLVIKGHELKAKNAQDHIVRLEEKETELKREYGRLHDRFNDLLKKHMECVEKSKMSMTESMFDSMPKNFQLPILRSVSNISCKDEMRGGGEYDPLQHLNVEVEKRDQFHNMRAIESMERDSNTDRIAMNEMGTAMSALSPLDDHRNRKKVIKPSKQDSNMTNEDFNDDDDDDDDDDDEDDLLGQIVNPAEFSSTGMSKEIENLILENTELLATKNALNVLKDDLIARLDETMSEQEILKEELKATQNLKDQLREQVLDLEAELRTYKEALDSERMKTHHEDGHDELSMAQRKRFTRLEMARVLMERNQYKERLMELQEAVRWTEMIRASREHPDLLPGSHHNSRKKSSLWNYFERLFVRRNDPPRRVASLAAVRYNAPTSPRRENLRLRSDLSEKRRRTDDQYKNIKAHVKRDDTGRMQAYGWSLPSSSSSPLAQSSNNTPIRQSLNQVSSAPTISRPENSGEVGGMDEEKFAICDNEKSTNNSADSSNDNGSNMVEITISPSTSSTRNEGGRIGRGMLPVPVPIYCRPLQKADPSIKLWCAATAYACETADPSCRVWICSSDAENKSTVTMVDARNPEVPLDQFRVSNEHILCITYVPGNLPEKDEDISKFTTDGIKVEESSEFGNGENNSNNNNDSNNTASSNSNNNAVSASIDQEPEETTKKIYKCNTEFAPASPTEGTSADVQETIVTLNHSSMWLGSHHGKVYIHHVDTDWKECAISLKLQDSVFAICHLPGRIFLALANGQVVVFCRSATDGAWNLSQHYSIRLGSSQYSVRCMCVIDSNTIWCACRNKIYVINATNLNVEKSFEAHSRIESQIRQMAFSREGVWVSIRLDSTLRLFDARNHQHLQDVDVEPYVSKMLGTGKLGFSFIRITCLMAACNRLWIGTGNGVIICVPLLEGGRPLNSELTSGVYKAYDDNVSTGDKLLGNNSGVITRASLPYCSMAQAQLSFHGCKDAVKFFVSLPLPKMEEEEPEERRRSANEADEKNEKSSSPLPAALLPCSPHLSSYLVMSGGEGYVDFRMGSSNGNSLGDADEELDLRRREGSLEKVLQSQQEAKSNLSHLIVWHVAPSRFPSQ